MQGFPFGLPTTGASVRLNFVIRRGNLIVRRSSGLATEDFSARIVKSCSNGQKALGFMLVRLTRTKRLRAGWLVALVYLLCVLGPTISFALPGSHALSACLSELSPVTRMAHVHAEVQSAHVDRDDRVHDHTSAHVRFDGDHGSVSSANPDPQAPHSSNGKCCGLTCVSALPAPLIDVVTPSAPMAHCEGEGHREVTDNTPPRLYRPPIS